MPHSDTTTIEKPSPTSRGSRLSRIMLCCEDEIDLKFMAMKLEPLKGEISATFVLGLGALAEICSSGSARSRRACCDLVLFVAGHNAASSAPNDIGVPMVVVSDRAEASADGDGLGRMAFSKDEWFCDFARAMPQALSLCMPASKVERLASKLAPAERAGGRACKNARQGGVAFSPASALATLFSRLRKASFPARTT